MKEELKELSSRLSITPELSEISIRSSTASKQKQYSRLSEEVHAHGAEPTNFPTDTYLVKETSANKTRWDVLMMLCILYSSVVVPVRICFHLDAEGAVWVFEATMSIMFLCDLVLTFNTAFIEEGEWVTSRARIARRYLSRWFWIDAPSSIPVELIELAVGGAASTHALSAFRVLRIIRVLRLVRLLHIGFYISRLEEHLA
jgi:hypothetical protein